MINDRKRGKQINCLDLKPKKSWSQLLNERGYCHSFIFIHNRFARFKVRNRENLLLDQQKKIYTRILYNVI